MAISGGDGSIILTTKVDESGLKKGLVSMGNTVKSVGSTIAKSFALIGAAAVAATVGITKMAVSAYADYEQLVGGVETLFKGSAQKIIDYANDAFYTAGISANEYMQQVTSFSASLIRSTAGDTDKAADIANMALIDISDNVNKMGSSMESVTLAYQGFAKQQYMLLDNLKLGYGGTKTEMERLLRDAQALTGVKYDINNLADVYSAIHTIQEELGITGTTAKEAEKTITGSANMMKAAWQNVLSAISGGGDLDRAINNLVYSIQKYFENIVPVVQRSLIGIGQLIAQVAPLLVQNVASALIQSIPSLINAVFQMILGLGRGIVEGIKALFTGGGGSSVTAQISSSVSGIGTSADVAANSVSGIGDAAKDAGKAAKKAGKEAQKSLAGFDKLQILTDKGGSGAGGASGGSGGGSSSPVGGGGSPTAIFEADTMAEEGLNIGQSLIDEIAKAWETGDFTHLGSVVGQKITDALNSIPWIGIQEMTNRLASSIATFLNGAITPELFSAIGSTVGNAINTSLYGAITFMEKFDFGSFGSSIMSGINAAILTLDWSQLANFISLGIAGAINFLAGFISKIDGTIILNAFISFFSGINWQQLGMAVGNLITSIDWVTVLQGALVVGIGIVAKKQITALFTTSIIPHIKTTIKTHFTPLMNYVKSLNIGGMLVSAFGLIVLIEGFRSIFSEGANWQNILLALGGALTILVGVILTFNAALLASSITWTIAGIMALGAAIALLITYWDDVVAAISGAAQWFYDNVIQPITDFFVELWEGVVEIFQNLWDGIVAIWNVVATWFNDNVIQPIATFFTTMWDGLMVVFSTVAEFFENVFKTAWEAIKNVWNVVVGFFQGIWTGIQNAFNTVVTWFSTLFTNAWNGIKTAWSGVSNFFSGVWDGIKSIFGSVADWFQNTFETAWTAVKNVFSAGGEIFSGIVDGIVTTFKSIVNALIDGINSVVTLPFEGLNTVLNKIQKLSFLNISPFSWLSWRLPIPQIPHLATGAVLPPNKPFMAIVGDQKRGTNIEAPLDTIVEAMNIALQQNSGGQPTKEEHYYLNETELMSIVYRLFKGGEHLNGKSLIRRG